MSLISTATSRGHMRFMIKEKGGANAGVFIEILRRLMVDAKNKILLIVPAAAKPPTTHDLIAYLRRLMIGAKNRIILIVDRGPAHFAKKAEAFVAGLGDKPTGDNFTTVVVNGKAFVVPRAVPSTGKLSPLEEQKKAPAPGTAVSLSRR
jgi:hypothetical protein